MRLSKTDAQEVLTVVVGCLTRWEAEERCGSEPSRLAGQGGQEAKQQVAVDGKTLRGTLLHEPANQPSVHVLSVYEVHSGLVLAQRPVQRKENEISASDDLLIPLYIKDRVWTAAAMHTQKKNCQRIEQYGGKYLFFFKDNHPTAHEDLRLFFEDPEADQSSWKVYSQTDKGHGRLTSRTVRTTTGMNGWFAQQWAGIGQTLQVIRTVTQKKRHLLEPDEKQSCYTKGKPRKQKEPPEPSKKRKPAKKQVKLVKETSHEVVYGFTNFPPSQASPQAIATFLRTHGAVENRLHYRRDVTLRDDHSQVRVAGRPEMLAALNNIVLVLMGWLGVRNVPEQMRIFSACPSLALELLLGPMTFE